MVWQEFGNVRAARLQDATWTAILPPLDVDPSLEAGTGPLRPKVAVSAEGYAVATWGDRRADGHTRVWARRLTGMNLSAFPQDLTLPDGPADSPDIDIEDDGSYAWVVFRQTIGGITRTLGRRLIGSQFEAPEYIDGGMASVDPKVDMSGAGRGQAVSQTRRAASRCSVPGSTTTISSPARGSTGSRASRRAKPEVAGTDRNDIAAAWRVTGGDGNSIARARFKAADEPWGGEATVSRPDLGPVADPGVFISGDRVGDFAVAMVQGTAGARTLSVAVFDRPPTAPFIESSQAYKRKTRPELRWRPGLELWGAQTYPRLRRRRPGRADAERHADTRDAARRPASTRGRSRPSIAPGRPRAAVCGRCASTPPPRP